MSRFPPFGPRAPSAPAAPEENKRASERGAPGPSRPGLHRRRPFAAFLRFHLFSPPPPTKLRLPSGGGRPETRSEFSTLLHPSPPRPEVRKGPARPASCVRREPGRPTGRVGPGPGRRVCEDRARSGPAEGERRGGAWSGPAGA